VSHEAKSERLIRTDPLPGGVGVGWLARIKRRLEDIEREKRGMGEVLRTNRP